ncbi:MAG: hypothetical protein HZA69_03680 [Gammaproteobacteria bacterium]|nr:hypothetical protein [Gammaproteobacteria bacterium]
MGVCRQTEEDDILLSGDGFEVKGRDARRGAALPDGKRVAAMQQVFHRPAHFAVAEDEHPV